MRLLLAVFVTVVAVAHSSHRHYRSPDYSSPGKVYHPHAETLRHIPVSYSPCRNGLAPRSDGKCVYPKVSKDVYFFNAPKFEAPFSPPLYEPIPKVHYNYVFVKTADKEKLHRPLIVPPAKQKTVVYLLSEKPFGGKQEVIEVPFHPTKPEVHFVGYQEGQNQRLPGGIDLQTALAHAEKPGNLLHSGSSAAQYGNVGHAGGFTESGNSLEGFGLHQGVGGHQGLGDHHGYSSYQGHSGHHGVVDHHGASDLHGISGYHGISQHQGILNHGGITPLHGVHYNNDSPHSHGFGEGLGGSFGSRYHRDVRQRHDSGNDEGSTRSSVSSSSGNSKRSQSSRFVPSPRVDYQ